MNEEEKTLNLDDVKFLLEKIHAAQQAGNHVIFRHSNYSTEVIAMEGEISEEKEWDKVAYHDDTQIVSLSVEKFYSDSPRVEVAISSI